MKAEMGRGRSWAAIQSQPVIVNPIWSSENWNGLSELFQDVRSILHLYAPMFTNY